VPFGLWMRTNLPETLHEPEPIAGKPVLKPTRLHEAYSRWRIMALGLVILASGTIATYTFSYLVTYAQATLNMSARSGFIAETIGYVLGIPVILLGGWLSDKHGRWVINVWGNFGFLLMIYPTFSWIIATRSEFAFIAGMTALNATSMFIWGSFYAGLAESLPQSIRGSGFGIIYSVSIAAFGGTTQLVDTWLIHVTGSAMAPAWYLIGAAGVGQIALRLMEESAPARTQRGLQLAPASSS
jgi:MFS transporter, MHS family, citrate/tricarballylate:H+ symporter